jgi:hypothetical protein
MVIEIFNRAVGLLREQLNAGHDVLHGQAYTDDNQARIKRLNLHSALRQQLDRLIPSLSGVPLRPPSQGWTTRRIDTVAAL